MMNIKYQPVRVNSVFIHPDEHTISLNDKWTFSLDPDDKGVQERWYERNVPFPDKINVPGTWQGQGFGTDSPEEIWDFGFKARVFRATYKGTGWYMREFDIPPEWQDKRIFLNFGGIHPSADIWLNGKYLGEHHEPFVPFGFDISSVVRREGKNMLIVRVHEENRIMGLAFNWRGNWSGLYRGVELRAVNNVYIEKPKLYADTDREILTLKLSLDTAAHLPKNMLLRITVSSLNIRKKIIREEFPVKNKQVNIEMNVPAPALWSPDTPNLYRTDIVLTQDGKVLDALSERIGFVKIECKKGQFLINNQPYFMRGNGEFINSPETGSPDYDRERWRKKLKTLREYGYNYVRCQSYAPTPEYLDAADEVGLLIQSEMGVLGAWGGMNRFHTYMWPVPSPGFRKQLFSQWMHTVERDVNHPSANIYCMSNEMRKNECFYPQLAWKCYRKTKSVKPTSMVIYTDGGYNEALPMDFVNAEATDTEYGKTEKPFIQHEFRWWSSFPDVTNMYKYTGAQRPYAAEIALKAASAKGIAHILSTAAKMSQRLQFLESKGKMEALRRDYPKLAGISHFSAVDLNPSPQGILDEFFEHKYIDADTWLETNGDTVVLCDLKFDNRVLVSGTEFVTKLFVSDYAHPSFKAPQVNWRICRDNEILANGRISFRHTPHTTYPIGEVKWEVPSVVESQKVKLCAELKEGKRIVKNNWDLWLFPHRDFFNIKHQVYRKAQYTWMKNLQAKFIKDKELHKIKKNRLIFSETLSRSLINFMEGGGKVFLAASEGMVRPFYPKLGLREGRYYFTPPANYGPYEDGQNAIIIKNHPMLGKMPHEGFADLNFYRIIAESPPVELAPIGLTKGEPVIRAVHSYPVCHPLAYLLERRVGKGILVISSMDFSPNFPEARYLIKQIADYATTVDVRNVDTIDGASLTALIEITSDI